jgi:diadenosine tetraphosphatase ApaH/serine/threonine PP2A family protein phosphatase
VVGELEKAGVQRWLCLGDIVGYGADARECVARVRELDPIIVGGNHDWAVAGRLDLEWFNAPARAAVVWTRKVLSRDDVAWLGSLELMRVHEDVTLAHSTLHDPGVFDYLQTPYDAYMSFQRLTTPHAFVGHSHVPITFFDGPVITYSLETPLELAGTRSLSNVGSVGQPRDEDPRAACGVYDSDTETLTLIRVPYDIEASASAIRRAGLPALLAERLRLGR